MFTREYGLAATIWLPLLKADGIDFAINTDWTPAAGDVQISLDGGAFANVATLPTFTNGAWNFALSAAEVTAARSLVRIVDSVAKAVQDDAFVVETFGHPSAADSRGVVFRGQVQASSTTTVLNLPSGGVTADNQYVGQLATLIDRTTRVPVDASRFISASANTGDTITVDPAFSVTPAAATHDIVIRVGLRGPALVAGTDIAGVATLANQTTAQTAIDAIPTNAELTAALADLPTVAELAAELAPLEGALAAIEADTQNLQTLVADVPTNAELATALDAIPTAAENATAVRSAIDATPVAANLTQVQGDALNGAKPFDTV